MLALMLLVVALWLVEAAQWNLIERLGMLLPLHTRTVSPSMDRRLRSAKTEQAPRS